MEGKGEQVVACVHRSTRQDLSPNTWEQEKHDTGVWVTCPQIWGYITPLPTAVPTGPWSCLSWLFGPAANHSCCQLSAAVNAASVTILGKLLWLTFCPLSHTVLALHPACWPGAVDLWHSGCMTSEYSIWGAPKIRAKPSPPLTTKAKRVGCEFALLLPGPIVHQVQKSRSLNVRGVTERHRVR